ncbi:MAG: hypothetical protein Q4G35_12730 [Propionibacteriaceae bacterium]|nr:hypothetical protein [Propionibacteriaceae bacterium]
MSEPKQIATLPPLEELRRDVPRSKRTGEPRRPVVVGAAAVILYLAVAAAMAVYCWHWWLAAHVGTYLESAWLVEWTKPEMGKWLSLTLEAVIAIALAAAAGAAGVAGFQAWNGWRFSRWFGLAAVALMAGFTAITSWWAIIPTGLTVVGVGLLFLPPVSRYFAHWREVRAERPEVYRRPSEVFYGRLPRYR